jgi:hypothetical protein
LGLQVSTFHFDHTNWALNERKVLIINKTTKEESDKAVDLFLEDTDNEISNWNNGVYKSSRDMQERVKKKIITGLIQLLDLQKAILITKLIQQK